MALTREQRAAWSAALRSGRYVQGRDGLMNPSSRTRPQTTWCCLGVLADTLGRNDLLHSSAAYLLEPTTQSRNWAILGEKTQISYARLNDEARRSFVEIADIVDQDDTLLDAQEVSSGWFNCDHGTVAGGAAHGGPGQPVVQASIP